MADKADLYEASPSWLRHTCITRLIQDGATIEQVSEFIGVSASVIQSTYWHHSPDSMTQIKMD
jgi:site-specific recombinase XerD